MSSTQRKLKFVTCLKGYPLKTYLRWKKYPTNCSTNEFQVETKY